MKTIPMQGKYSDKQAIVDDDMFAALSQYKWYYTPDGYAQGKIDGERVYMHRYVAKTPRGQFTDHINHNKLDNQRSNLRVCTHAENMQNRKTGDGTPGTIKRQSMNGGKYVYYYGMIKINKVAYQTTTCPNIEQARGALKQLIASLR